MNNRECPSTRFSARQTGAVPRRKVPLQTVLVLVIMQIIMLSVLMESGLQKFQSVEVSYYLLEDLFYKICSEGDNSKE